MKEATRRKALCLRLEREALAQFRRLRGMLRLAGWEAGDFSQHCIKVFLGRAAAAGFNARPYLLEPKRVFPVFAWQRAMEILRLRHWPARPFSDFGGSRRNTGAEDAESTGLGTETLFVCERRCCEGPPADPVLQLERTLLRQQLTLALGILPEKVRIIVELRHACGRKPREIALETGLAVTRIYELLREARRLLRRELAGACKVPG